MFLAVERAAQPNNTADYDSDRKIKQALNTNPAKTFKSNNSD